MICAMKNRSTGLILVDCSVQYFSNGRPARPSETRVNLKKVVVFFQQIFINVFTTAYYNDATSKCDKYIEVQHQNQNKTKK